MKAFDKISIDELQFLAKYLLNNRNDIEGIIREFGEIASRNGVGTMFLTPHDPIFRTFWIYEKDGKANGGV